MAAPVMALGSSAPAQVPSGVRSMTWAWPKPAGSSGTTSTRRAWAQERDLDPDEVEVLFTRIVAYARRLQGGR